jgi:hypothetical protein
MPINWPDKSDEELRAEAQQGLAGQGAVVEAMRRLRISIDTLRVSNERYANWMMFWTIVLAALTALLVLQGIVTWLC